jgi:hypothetical protein
MPHNYLYPRPEYPRPDRQRGTLEGVDWLNLNGPWQFRFDGARRGVEENWFAPEQPTWREQIVVPFCWESLAAWREGDSAGNENYYSTRIFLNPLEVTRMNHRAAPRYEVGWYRRTVQIPNTEPWQNKRVILTVGAADFFTDCWCNGKHLGRHEGGYTPFEFDLTDVLTTTATGQREGMIVLRVEDPMDNHEQPVGKQWRWYTTVSGIWQTVFIEPRAATHIDNFRITSDIDLATAHFVVSCSESGKDVVHLTIRAPDGTALPEVKIPVVDGLAQHAMKVTPLLLWDPNTPNLYRVKMSLRRNGKVLDEVNTYFGMRKIDFASLNGPTSPVHLRLNGAPRYLRGALYQSFFPEGVYTPGDVRRYIDDIASAKQFGFNFLRIHIKVDEPLLLYYADTMGVLLMADFPNFGEGGNTPLGQERFERMMRETIKRDFNHPSIIAWCTFNETWGFGGQEEFVKLIHPGQPKTPSDFNEEETVAQAVPVAASTAVVAEASNATAGEALGSVETAVQRSKLANLPAHAWVQKMWDLAKKLDPTRLVEDMSVCHWEHLDYFAHGDTDINSWHFYINDYERAKEHIAKVVQSTYPGSTFNYVPGFEHRGQPLINSEYGGIGALDGDRDVSWSFKFLTSELRRHQHISAYIYTELHDVEWEYNGFLNYDRTRKNFGYDPALINSANVLILDAPPVSRGKPGAAVKLPVLSSHYSVQEHNDVTLAWRLGAVDTLGQLHPNLQSGFVPLKFPHRHVAPATTLELRLPEFASLCTVTLDAVAGDGTVVANNYAHFLVAAEYPATLEEHPRSLILRRRPHEWTAAEWSGPMRTRSRSESSDECFGHGHGFFEWSFPLGEFPLQDVRRLRVLCELSARRGDFSQTDDDLFQTEVEVQLNGVTVHQAMLSNHPHDARGVLSYLRGARGAYGYLTNASIEHDLLQRIFEGSKDGIIRLRCVVPASAVFKGGLTVYGAECGRYPICPTLVLEK